MDAAVRAVSNVARPEGSRFINQRTLDNEDELVPDMFVERHMSARTKLDDVRFAVSLLVRP